MRRELAAFLIPAQPLPGIELALREEATRK
jgi:hypothetical protein